VRRRILAAFAAILLLVVGSFVLLAYVRGADERALAGVQTVEVLVVDETIPAGTAGDELKSLVRTELVPAKVALDGRVTDLADLSGRVASVDLLAGEQLLASRFVRPDDLQVAGTVAVPDGLQEVSVLLEPQRVVSGRISAGDTVGVYLSQVLPDGTGQTSAVLHHVLVTQVQGAPTAPDAEAEADAETASATSGAPVASLMLTLAINAEDAETVVFGMEHGTLWLSLETEGDSTGGTRVIDPGTIYRGVPR
jgi:pilus assembly protein CpaB